MVTSSGNVVVDKWKVSPEICSSFVYDWAMRRGDTDQC